MHADITSALSSALQHLQNSIKAASNNTDAKNLSDSLWLASAEAEYAVFLLSLVREDKSEASFSNSKPRSKQSIEIEPTLKLAEQLLESAKTNIEAGNTTDSYDEASKARNLLFGTQEWLEKKQKQPQRQATQSPRRFCVL
jgi:hypothetical protein